MKQSFVRRILVGMITLTTVFSSVGTVVAAATEGGAIVTEVTTSTEASSEASFFEPFAEEELESAGSESTIANTEASTQEVTFEASEESSNESSVASSETSEENLDTKEFDLASLEVSTDEELPEEEMDMASMIGAMLAETKASTTYPDLGDTSFAEVENFLPGSIDDITKEVTLGFKFFIYNAEDIPEGIFTYSLPDELDFPESMGKEITVYENGVKIGTASVDSKKVMTFHIDPTVVAQKPNGLEGSVSLSCKFNGEVVGDQTPVTVVFSNGQEVSVVVKNPVITATKRPVTIKDGKAWFSVKFTVSDDVKDFVITDELGENLEFLKDSVKFSNTRTYLRVNYELETPNKLVVHAGNVSAGSYILRYQVKAVGDYDTSKMTIDDKLNPEVNKNINKASWSWENSRTHEVYSYADQTRATWLSKYGTNRSNPGAVDPSGVCQWQIYINGGSMANDLTGYTFVDELDPNMEYIKDSFVVKLSSDQKVWFDCPQLAKLISDYLDSHDDNKIVITFDETIPSGYYRIFYNSKIKGTLPVSKTKYTNKVYLYKDGELVKGAEATNEYNFSGEYAAKIEKGIEKERDENGFVTWKSVFTIAGEKAGYNVEITDTIEPAEDSKMVSGKVVGAYMVQDESVNLVKIDGDKETPVKGFNVKFSEENTYTLTAKNLKAGTYAIYYKTQDYCHDKETHTYPSGSKITIINNASLKIDKTTIYADPAYYEIVSDGLPMMKEAVSGYLDDSTSDYIIPWKVTVNKNELGQSAVLSTGSDAVVRDLLPEGLEYVSGSAQIFKADAQTGEELEPTVSKADGKETLSWNFVWDADYYVISFNTRVTDSHIKAAIAQGGNGRITFSFDNEVRGEVGNVNGMANAGSQDTVTLLEKLANLNEETGLIEYSIVANELGTDLFADKDEVELTDKLDSGRYEVGSLKVYELSKYDENAQDNSAALFALDNSKVTVAEDGRSFSIKLPDDRAFLVKYSVIPDASQGTEAGAGKINVTISNEATLVGEGVISSSVKDTYTVKNVHADITSNKGAIRITKVSTGNSLVGLQGAVFKLVRVDTASGAETEIARSTSDGNGVVKFEKDGDFDSLIFDVLYYYQEVSAPTGYKLDDTKHYIVFKGQKYEANVAAIKAYLGQTAYVEYDITTSETGATFADVVENDLIPEDQEEPSDNPTDNTTVVTVTSSTTTVGGEVVTVLDLPEVLGASRNPGDLPEVLGARRASTGDSNMGGAFAGLIIAFLVLGFVLTKKAKDSKLDS